MNEISEMLYFALDELRVLDIDVASFSSLPQTVTDSRIKDDMVVLSSTLSNPSAQTGDWTVTTADGSMTIDGSISGSTAFNVKLQHSR